ncbi:efflux RND transporter permease subunit [Halieaceae bacterium IMCC14734]|uniref:Efflux RND transporter permease subunit n=1 Tax=Candidatus Litorirhabdus singularis TaxID=2518993 RepID=A0ABT3TBZ2_9GAMM|nr:efflux RND transporter permease subunit [Candidatus Litorirhabdus singularis]MCX2979695.1 efflux RND transporter permease subunit [Candidatus Litorirhabdus singularis]
MNPLDRLVRSGLEGAFPKIIFLVALIAGLLALQFTPREEEPQIVVPMVDVLVTAPGLSPRQVERQVVVPLEKLLAQIPGVEHVYSASSRGQAVVTLRFYVGEDREDSILNAYNKLNSNRDKVPGVVSDWMMRPVEVDDVPILLLGLWSDTPARYDDFALRRIADEISTVLQRIPLASEVNVSGGRPRLMQILLRPESLAARKTTATDIVSALQLSNRLQSAGDWSLGNESIQLESGDFLQSADELAALVVNVVDGVPVYLQEVAMVVDGPAEPDNYTWLSLAPGHPGYASDPGQHPMVSISVAKQRGSNAVAVASQVHRSLELMRAELLPPEIHVEVLRDYGETANAKVNNLSLSLAFAIFTVVVFIGVFLGWRPALVVGLAVPICYGATLALDMYFGYTINRVTLFALILSLGLVVDDPITGVDNIERQLRTGAGDTKDRIVDAMAEIRVPLLMSTLTIVLAFVPLAFITGMMGPYMAPMAFNVPLSVIASTVVAFMVTPWLASKLLKPTIQSTGDSATGPTAQPPQTEGAGEGALAGYYTRLLGAVLGDRRRSWLLLALVMVMFIMAALLPLLRLVPLKLLPFDNKNEVQVVIDMPEGTTLEATAAKSQQVTNVLLQLPELRAVAVFAGQPSPIDFNGMVRQYYARQQPHLADLRITLAAKGERRHQSHAIVLRMRELLAPLNQNGVSVKVVEAPPGPPVMSTLVAEVYGDELSSYAELSAAALQLRDRLAREAHVVDVDSSVEVAQQRRLRFVADKQKAALSGIATEDINLNLAIANQGYVAGYLNLVDEAQPLPIELKLPPHQRASVTDLQALMVKGRAGIVQQSSRGGIDAAPQPLVAVGELGRFEYQAVDPVILHKDLRPVVYVTAELSGRTPAEVIADVVADRDETPASANDWRSRSFLNPGGGDGWSLPETIEVVWTGEGEWHITVRVFRDMGLAFAFALVAIYAVLRIQTGSAALSGIIMSAIPLTIIGIMPGFWLLNQIGEREVAGAPEPILFTATAMIGMIALAGIVVRNSLILVEFIGQARARGLALRDALLQAGMVRMRPVLLTAGTTMLGNLVIILDPVFSGLALAIIFGIFSSTLFTLLVIPVVYQLVFDESEQEVIGHG